MRFDSVPLKDVSAEEVARTGTRWLRSRYAEWILAAVSVAESVFAPIIIDPFLVALILANRAKWIRYTLVAVGSSVLGGVLAYVLGVLFFDTIGVKLIEFYGLEHRFASISTGLNENGFVFVLIGAFTPIPYKLVALGSGFLHIHFLTFLVASVFGRLFRLGLVGFAAFAVGPHALPMMQRNLHLLAAIVGVILVAYVFFRVAF